MSDQRKRNQDYEFDQTFNAGQISVFFATNPFWLENVLRFDTHPELKMKYNKIYISITFH